MQESDDAVNVLGAPAHCSYHSNTSVQAGGACVRRGLCADQAHAIHVVGSCDVGQEWGARGACSRVQGGTSVRSAYLQCLSTAYPLLVALPEHASVAIRPRQGCLPPLSWGAKVASGRFDKKGRGRKRLTPRVPHWTCKLRNVQNRASDLEERTSYAALQLRATQSHCVARRGPPSDRPMRAPCGQRKSIPRGPNRCIGFLCQFYVLPDI